MTGVAETFTGFGDGAVEFYDGLLADNSKAYWTDQRPVYEGDVRGPMLALLADLEPEFGVGKVFRPYRDVRFSKDKTPYKTHCGGFAPPYYVQLSSDGLMVAVGYYRMESDQVARFRTAVDDERRGADLQARLEKARKAGLEPGGETLTRAPRGFAPDHPRIDLLRHKSLHLSRRWPPDDVLHERDCIDRVAQVWRAARPLAEWLADHVGPSDRPRR
ncbi:MAG: TIGR02453 family protein [Pseudonocardia sp. SCN 72-86]|nr:MAG: TIGR02453 family protein [Pseudonocardia sp. SCN 72-86]